MVSKNIGILAIADKQKDKLLIFILFVHLFLVYPWALMDQHFHAVLPLTVAYVASLIAYRFQPGSNLSRSVITTTFVVASATYIHLSGGLVEMHFHIFAMLALLAIYYDWKVIALAGFLVAVHHLYGLINQDLYSVYEFNSNILIYLLHVVFVILTCLSLVYLIQVQRFSFKIINVQNDALMAEIERHKNTAAHLRQSIANERELSDLKTRFVTNTSHEFRTPLAGILSNVELLEHYSARFSEEKKQEILERIKSSGNYMTGLLEDILLIGRAEGGQLDFNLAPVDLEILCRLVLVDLQAEVGEKYDFTLQMDGMPEPIYADAVQLRYVVANLLSNAVKYSLPGSKIELKVVYGSETVALQVRDEGIGIPLEDRARVFDKFHRASNVGTIAGTGLGLSIVKNSVDMHGGSVAITSEVGQGTTVIVTIPRKVAVEVLPALVSSS